MNEIRCQEIVRQIKEANKCIEYWENQKKTDERNILEWEALFEKAAEELRALTGCDCRALGLSCEGHTR